MKTMSLSKPFGPLLALILFASCGGKTTDDKNSLPENFASLDDSSQVAFMMKNSTPDSVARFICNASLGKVKSARIDTLAIAVAYAYQNYNDSDLIVFSREFDDFSANLPLNEKMKIYSMAGNIDPQGLGYELGLEYVTHIRENKMSVDDIRTELNAFKEACANDSDMYNRFLKGFKTVLKVDHGKDLPEEVYNAFINL
jgi:lipoprotein